MAEMNAEQDRVLAIARARRRLQEQALLREMNPGDPTAGMSSTELVLAGAGRGFVDIARGAGQLIGRGPSPSEVDEQRLLDAPLMARWPAKGGYFGSQLIPAAVTLPLSPVTGGILAGGAIGALQPVGEGERRATNVAVGAVAGGAIPATSKVVKALATPVTSAVSGLLDNLIPSRAANRYQRAIVGDNRARIVDALRNAPEYVTGSKPTAAEAVIHLPEGSPIVAHQTAIAKSPGGVSAQFGQRKLDQAAARATAKEARDVATAPLRQGALDAANVGGIKVDALDASIDALQKRPGLRASDVVSRTLTSVREKIARVARADGSVDAEDLYMIRKEIGNTIKTHAKETANFDKRLTAGLQKDIQTGIDDAIKKAGGTGWDDYLREFSTRSQAIEKDVARAKSVSKPVQKTTLQGASQESPLPNLLSRPAMIANFILRRLGHNVEPKVQAITARRYLYPQELADVLEDIPAENRKKVVKILADRLGRPVASGGSASAATGDY